jgi:hypothetical protein
MFLEEGERLCPDCCSLFVRVLRTTLQLEQLAAFHDSMRFTETMMKNLVMTIYKAWIGCLGRAVSDRNTSIIAINHSFI